MALTNPDWQPTSNSAVLSCWPLSTLPHCFSRFLPLPTLTLCLFHTNFHSEQPKPSLTTLPSSKPTTVSPGHSESKSTMSRSLNWAHHHSVGTLCWTIPVVPLSPEHTRPILSSGQSCAVCSCLPKFPSYPSGLCSVITTATSTNRMVS